VRSAYSYLVELDGARQHVHANKVRKLHLRVDEVIYDDALMLSDRIVS